MIKDTTGATTLVVFKTMFNNKFIFFSLMAAKYTRNFPDGLGLVKKTRSPNLRWALGFY